MKNPAQVFKAYLDPHEWVSGGFLSAREAADEITLAVASGARMWKRSDYLGIVRDVPERLSPDGQWFASIREHNIVLRPARTPGGEERVLTSDGTSEHSWDIESSRYRIASGRRRSASRSIDAWSPDSSILLAYRRDITGVYRQPRVHWLRPFDPVKYFPAPRAGATLDRIQPVIVDILNNRRVPVALASLEDRYIQWLGWHPSGQKAWLIVYTRDFKGVEVLAVNRESGATRAILSESAATFVRIWHDAIFGGEHGLRMLPGGDGFLWLSARNGWNHLYRYSGEGRQLRQLTSGGWPVDEIEHIGTDGFVYFTASIDTARPYDVHVCRVSLEGGGIERLTREEGLHSPTFSRGQDEFFDTHSAVGRPARTDLLRTDGTPVRAVSSMNISRLETLGYIPAEEFNVKAANGVTDLWGVMYKPFDFDPSRLYPVLQYIYGGPQTVETAHFFAIDQTTLRSANFQWALAHLGYIVICLDARGTPGRSKAFHDIVCGNWNVGIPDHAGALRQLCGRHAWMDIRRVGIYGHSWGGYFAARALLDAPDLYRAAVSYAPAFDPWASILYEPYLDLPQRNRAAYEEADLVKQAARMKRPLMILAGSSDDNAFNTAMKMTRALIEAGIDHEFVAVPEAGHHFAGPEEDYLLMKLTGWFERHLGPDGS